MKHRRIALFAALLVFCLIPAFSLSTGGTLLVLKTGDTLTVTDVAAIGDGTYLYSVQLPDGSVGYIGSDAILSETAAQTAGLLAAQSAQQRISEPTATPKPVMVWIPKSGSKYHSRSNCSNMKNPTQITKTEAERKGYTPCKKCH